MWNFLKNITGNGVASGVNATSDLVGTVWGSKSGRENNQHAENMSVHNQHAAEYQYRGARNWFDSLVDGANRLVRPAFTYGIVSLFGWAIWGAKDFLDFAARLTSIPDPLWMVMGTIIAFWFGSRSIFKDKQKFAVDPKRVKAAYAAAGEVRKIMSVEQEVIQSQSENSNSVLRLYGESKHERRL